MNIIDESGKGLRIIKEFLRVDGIPVFKIIEKDGIKYAQFCDKDRLRANCRGAQFVEVPLDVFVLFLQGVQHEETKT